MGLEASAVTLTNTYMEVVTTQKMNFSEDDFPLAETSVLSTNLK